MDSSPGSTPYSAPTGCPMRGERQTSLYGPEFASDPQRVYDTFRAHGLAAPIELAPGVEATLIVQHEAALRVLQNPSFFARDARRWAALREGRVPLDSPVLPMMAYRPNCLFTDGTEHLRLRKAVTESLGLPTPPGSAGTSSGSRTTSSTSSSSAAARTCSATTPSCCRSCCSTSSSAAPATSATG